MSGELKKKTVMLEYSCLVLFVMAVGITNVHADEGWVPTSERDYEDLLLVCGKEYAVTDADITRVIQLKDVTIINPCMWACSLKKSGFLDDKGQYVLFPGLTYVRNIVKNDEAYSNLENIAKQCESVKDKTVSDGEAGCEMGALVAACFVEQLMKSRRHEDAGI